MTQYRYTQQVVSKTEHIPQCIERVIKKFYQVPDEHVDTRQFTHYTCEPSFILIILYLMVGSALYFYTACV